MELRAAGRRPYRQRCQSVVTDAEREAGVKLIEQYRAQEAIARDNDIEGKAEKLNRSYRVKTLTGVEQENLRREIAAADHGKFLAAEARLAELRKEAFVMVEPIFKRFIKSLDDELNAAAIAAEQRLDATGIPIKQGDTWMLHDDAICKALWSQRNIAERTLVELKQHQDGIGACQWCCTLESQVPFQWLS